MTETTLPELTVLLSGSSGIEIRAKLSEKYNLREFTLNSEPQPIFISPWMQFEPSEMNAERARIAFEIVHRATSYEKLMKRVEELEKWNDQQHETYRRQLCVQNVTNQMWKDDRKKAGLPEDFSDIKEWPPEMMSQYLYEK